jgi:hypothetical protein
MNESHSSMILCNADMLSHIIPPLLQQHICLNPFGTCRELSKLKTTINALSRTNKFLYKHYSNKKEQQAIVRTIADYGKLSDQRTADSLCLKSILTQITQLQIIAETNSKLFSPKDLQDPWYLNCTIDMNKRSLLIPAIRSGNIKKIQDLITAGIQINHATHSYPLITIYEHRELLFDLNNNTRYLDIAQLLLQNGADPNRSQSYHHHTPLMYATKHGDTLYTYLLLLYNADPYIQKQCAHSKQIKTAFDLEPEKGWLQEIIDKIQQQKGAKGLYS